MNLIINKLKITYVLSFVFFLLMLQGCSKKNDNPVSTQQPSSNNISIQDFAFSPTDLTVAVGTTITWTNKDGVAHTVTSGTPGSPSGTFDSGNISQNGTFSFKFNQAGTFKYFCRIHTMMTGVVTVQ